MQGTRCKFFKRWYLSRISCLWSNCNYKKEKQPISLYSHIYSTESKEFKSMNGETLKSIEYIKSIIEKKCTFVCDRGQSFVWVLWIYTEKGTGRYSQIICYRLWSHFLYVIYEKAFFDSFWFRKTLSFILYRCSHSHPSRCRHHCLCIRPHLRHDNNNLRLLFLLH